MIKNIFFYILLISVSDALKAQCISLFPSLETFESAPTWTVGGSNSDWAWGTPSKATITGAGGGLKCWCVAGLTGNTYNNSEQAYIVSPCYDLSSLTYPYVTFKVFWESEWLYDGASLQYSTNNGTTWVTVGAFNDPVNCMTQNWYNKASITYLAWITPTNKNGWAGNAQSTSGSCQGGNGSNGWVTAKHCLNGLAGQSNVKFRFTFGSGTTCNTFDGFAIDDFSIANAPPNAPAFTYTCNAFTAINPPCPTPSNYLWNFGDPNSGATNTSTLSNPTHQFSSAGMYTVSLTSSGGPCNAPGTITQTISVLGFSVISTTSVSCYGGNNGSASVIGNNGTPAYSYTWLPSGGNSNMASSLSSGIYTITVKDANNCRNSGTVSITQPSSLTVVTTQSNVSCFGGNNGLATIAVTGGTGAYTYTWLPNNSNNNSLTNVSQGNYSLAITDANGCNAFKTILITQPSASLSTIISATAANCGLATGKVTALTNGGTSNYFYTWLPSGGTNNTATNLSAGIYTVTIVDANSCSVSAVATITDTPAPTCVISATNNNCFGGANGSAKATVIGNSASYTYTWLPTGGNNATANQLIAGTYTCLVQDASFCSTSQTIVITEGIPIIVSTSNYSACPNETVTLSASATGGAGGPYSYLWNNNSANSVINTSAANTTNYSVTATDVNGCVSLPTTSKLYIYQDLKANFNASEYTVSTDNPIVTFIDNSSGNPTSWSWFIASIQTTTTQNTSYHFNQVGVYTVQLNITNSKGCRDSIIKSIKVIADFLFYIPNTFSPDGNAVNDIFIPVGTGWNTSSFNFWVYDRWGATVFYTTDYLKGWDGIYKNNLVTNDIYTWKVELKDEMNKTHHFIGRVTLLN